MSQTDAMADIEFFFDPLCPWAWITSRWVSEVRTHRDLDVRWRFISLAHINEGRELSDEHRRATQFSRRLLRIAARVRDESDGDGNDDVGAFYTACGDLLHVGGRSSAVWHGEDPGDVAGEALAAAGLPVEWADAADDERWDSVVHAESDLALSRAGDDVGTPIVTYDTSRPETATMFGPVMNRIPRGDEAVELWDAMWVVARTPGLAEFKRSIRGEPAFD